MGIKSIRRNFTSHQTILEKRAHIFKMIDNAKKPVADKIEELNNLNNNISTATQSAIHDNVLRN